MKNKTLRIPIPHSIIVFCLLFFHGMCADIPCSKIAPPLSTHFEYMNGTTVQTGNLKYTVALSTSNPADQNIITCGKFDYAFGILARLDKNLDMEWNTVTSRECAGLVLNAEEDYVTTAIENLPNGFEVISLNSTGGEVYYAFQMIDLQNRAFAGIHDLKYSSDYIWVLGSKSSGACLISQIGPFTFNMFNCIAHVKFQSMAPHSSGLFMAGVDTANSVHFVKVDPEEVTVNTSLTMECGGACFGVVDVMLVNQGTDDEEIFTSMVASAGDKLYVSSLAQESLKFNWFKSLTLSLDTVMVKHSSVLGKYFVVIKDSTTGTVSIMTINPSSSTIDRFKSIPSSTYSLEATSFSVSDANSFIGGQISSAHFHIFRTGITLTDFTCPFSGSSMIPSSNLTLDEHEISFENSTITIDSDNSYLFLNRTDNDFGTYSGVTKVDDCTPTFSIPYVENRAFAQRFMETLPEICPGFGSEALNTTGVKFTYPDIKNLEFHSVENSTVKMSTFHTPSKVYEVEVKVENEGDGSGYASLLFNLDINFTFITTMCIAVTIGGIILILVTSIIQREAFLLMNTLYSFQFIHLAALSPVTLTSTYGWFVQSIGAFSFVVSYLNYACFHSLKIVDLDSYYTSGYETLNFLANSALSIGACFLLLIPYAIWYVVSEEYEHSKRDQEEGSRPRSYYYEKLKIIVILAGYHYPHFCINSVMQVKSWGFEGIPYPSSFFAFLGLILAIGTNVVVIVYFMYQIAKIKNICKLRHSEKKYTKVQMLTPVVSLLFWLKRLLLVTFLTFPSLSPFFVSCGVFSTITILGFIEFVFYIYVQKIALAFTYIFSQIPAMLFSLMTMTLLDTRISYIWKEKGSQRICAVMSGCYLIAYFFYISRNLFTTRREDKYQIKLDEVKKKEKVPEREESQSDISNFKKVVQATQEKASVVTTYNDAEMAKKMSKDSELSVSSNNLKPSQNPTRGPSRVSSNPGSPKKGKKKIRKIKKKVKAPRTKPEIGKVNPGIIQS